MVSKSQIDNKDNPNLLSDLTVAGAIEIDRPVLERLDALTRDELLALCKRCGMVEQALMTKEEVAEAFLVKLAHIGLTGDNRDAMAAINQWLDRQHGKPMQSVQTKNLNVSLDVSESDKAILKRFYGEYRE